MYITPHPIYKKSQPCMEFLHYEMNIGNYTALGPTTFPFHSKSNNSTPDLTLISVMSEQPYRFV